MERPMLPSIHHIIQDGRSYDHSLTLAPLKTNASRSSSHSRQPSYDPQTVPRSLANSTPNGQPWQPYGGMPPPPVPAHALARPSPNPHTPRINTSSGYSEHYQVHQLPPQAHPHASMQYPSYAAVPQGSPSPVTPPGDDDIFSASMKYECDICKKRFYRPSGLKIHLASHSDVKPYVCPVEGCGRSFGVLSNMRRHARLHSSGGNAASEDSYQ
ncbi:hypothetical protein HGRIS_002809 [Hohenbuehelia grisea]|uniref:C2H2-type domain-containing protein n=1 Tax=Hohenbuehelia grisea TaxID=104357 RepID=A0ABR3JNQ7_9AGAR